MKKRIWLLAAACVLLSGCASLLDREYSRVEAHSSKFWESEDTGILRAESYQDIVNDLMLLVGRHADQAVIRLYSYDDGVTVADRLEQAAVELVRSTRPVTQIAQSAGYDNASKFSESFKKRYGATPSQYRAHAKEAAKQSIETKME